MTKAILINDILNISDLKNTKIRFVIEKNPEHKFQSFKHQRDRLLGHQFYNYKNKSFKKGQTAIGFVKIANDEWLLFDISRITKDLNQSNTTGYEFQTLSEYEKYFGRIIIKYKNTSQNLIRNASKVIDQCEVLQLLDSSYENNNFPGYENVNISWRELKNLINKDTWRTALENQKGVYLITDQKTGKKYVGAAYGEKMIHRRWSDYIKNGHGGNKDLKSLDFEYIKNNFTYSILEIFKSTVDVKFISKRETWWKEVLLSRTFGYNKN